MKNYNFIIVTEVFEHLFNLLFEIERLCCVLKVNGYLSLMTSLLSDNQDFFKFYYKNNLSYVCFFSFKTADYLKAELEIVDDNVIFLKKL